MKEIAQPPVNAIVFLFVDISYQPIEIVCAYLLMMHCTIMVYF
jgi:hypothetical protein